MSVERETIAARHGNLEIDFGKVEMVRQANGDWTLRIEMRVGDHTLKDGRTLTFPKKLVTVRGRQLGRKP